MHNGTKQRPQMYTIRNPLYYLRKLVLASKVERLSVWNAVHLVHFGPLLDYCPIWFFSKKKKYFQFGSLQSILVQFGPVWTIWSIQSISVHFSTLRSNSVHIGLFLSTSVYFGPFSPLRSTSVQFIPLLSILIHVGPFSSKSLLRSILVQFNPL